MDWKRIVCPNCHRAYKVEHVLPDERMQCHACKHEFHTSECKTLDDIFTLQPKQCKTNKITVKKTTQPKNIKQKMPASVQKEKKRIAEKKPQPTPHHTAKETVVPMASQSQQTIKPSPTEDTQETLSSAYDQDIWGETPKKRLDRDELLKTWKKKTKHLHIRFQQWTRHLNLKPWGIGFAVCLLLIFTWSGIKDSLLSEPKSRSVLMQLNVALQLKYTDWRVLDHLEMEWVESNNGRDLLLVKGKIQNRLNVKLPLPFIRIRMYAEYNPERLIQEQILPIKMVDEKNILSMPPEQLPMDLEIMNPLEERDFTLVVEHLAYDVGHITMRPTLKRPK